ncbi:unnamed protein product [Rotaria magnacalcarata]|nr:unnamed protein product [Rotaria magnacalcarata]CAF1595558.1 unnamed protein product [Rotaria magnacalcarata]CAF2072121.1 unnamed protein product [Rotaria magnacalcarata]CAF2097840.1 unnamed protein product [Rotaria magnacalcarata]CAF2134919.1 unnamed protein product [Rotaria magnacalcarata]
MVTRRRHDLTSPSFCSSCTSATSNLRRSELSSGSLFSSPLISFQRPILKSARRYILPTVPPAWSPISPISPQVRLRDFCLPLPESPPPVDILNRSSLSSCSPSLVKFSRASIKQRASVSTSTTALPGTLNPANSLHPTTTFLTVNGIKANNHHHQHRYRQTR